VSATTKPNVSIGEQHESPMLKNYPDAVVTPAKTFAVDGTSGAHQSWTQHHDGKGGWVVEETRTGGKWLQFKSMEPKDLSTSKNFEKLEKQLIRHVDGGLEKFADRLKLGDMYKPPAAAGYKADGGKTYLHLKNPDQLVLRIEVPGMTPEQKAHLQKLANEHLDNWKGHLPEDLRTKAHVEVEHPSSGNSWPTGDPHVSDGKMTAPADEKPGAPEGGSGAHDGQGAPAGDGVPSADSGTTANGGGQGGSASADRSALHGTDQSVPHETSKIGPHETDNGAPAADKPAAPDPGGAPAGQKAPVVVSDHGGAPAGKAPAPAPEPGAPHPPAPDGPHPSAPDGGPHGGGRLAGPLGEAAGVGGTLVGMFDVGRQLQQRVEEGRESYLHPVGTTQQVDPQTALRMTHPLLAAGLDAANGVAASVNPAHVLVPLVVEHGPKQEVVAVAPGVWERPGNGHEPDGKQQAQINYWKDPNVPVGTIRTTPDGTKVMKIDPDGRWVPAHETTSVPSYYDRFVSNPGEVRSAAPASGATPASPPPPGSPPPHPAGALHVAPITIVGSPTPGQDGGQKFDPSQPPAHQAAHGEHDGGGFDASKPPPAPTGDGHDGANQQSPAAASDGHHDPNQAPVTAAGDAHLGAAAHSVDGGADGHV
jgi:hypothetical protein